MRLQKEGHNNIGKVMVISILAKPKLVGPFWDLEWR
jgi:hypothetical protein